MSRKVMATSLLVLAGCALFLSENLAHPKSFVQSLSDLVYSPTVACGNPSYTVRILSHDPLMIHIENFITPAERKQLLEIAGPTLEKSMVKARNGSSILSKERTSSSAFLDRKTPVAQCIYDRVSEFQGFEPVDNIEALQVTAYQLSEEFRNHFDWFGSIGSGMRDRTTTIFGILEADCDNCGTRFQDIQMPLRQKDERWCRIVNCTAPELTVLPIPGSALFWRNLHMNGTGDVRMRHAGLPLTRGVKTGLNIWTQQELPPDVKLIDPSKVHRRPWKAPEH